MKIVVAIALFLAGLWGGHNIASAADDSDPCNFDPGVIQVTTDTTLPDAPPGGSTVACVSASDVTVTAGLGNFQIGVAIGADNVVLDGTTADSLYGQTWAANTTVLGSLGDDNLEDYGGFGGTMLGFSGEDVLTSHGPDAPELAARMTAATVRQVGGRGPDMIRATGSALNVSLAGSRGNDVIRTDANEGTVRGGRGFDICKTKRSVTTQGCEVIKRWR